MGTTDVLGAHVYYIVSMTTTTAKASGTFVYNSLTVPHMEMKLGTHVCNIVSMTTTKISLRHFSLKLPNCSTHGDET